MLLPRTSTSLSITCCDFECTGLLAYKACEWCMWKWLPAERSLSQIHLKGKTIFFFLVYVTELPSADHEKGWFRCWLKWQTVQVLPKQQVQSWALWILIRSICNIWTLLGRCNIMDWNISLLVLCYTSLFMTFHLSCWLSGSTDGLKVWIICVFPKIQGYLDPGFGSEHF